MTDLRQQDCMLTQCDLLEMFMYAEELYRVPCGEEAVEVCHVCDKDSRRMMGFYSCSNLEVTIVKA